MDVGVDRISIADTVGIWHPNKCHEVIKFVRDKFACEVEAPLHNDIGLDPANAIAAIDDDATVIDASYNESIINQ